MTITDFGEAPLLAFGPYARTSARNRTRHAATPKNVAGRQEIQSDLEIRSLGQRSIPTGTSLSTKKKIDTTIHALDLGEGLDRMIEKHEK